MPSSPAARAAATAAVRSLPASSSDCIARTAGASASTIVLSPSCAAPSSTTPASAAASASASSRGPKSGASPSALPARRKAVPHSGPLAPPTVETSVEPAVVRSLPGGASSPSSFATTAVKPRSMLVPWSASPIAASSCVRQSRCSCSVAAAASTHRFTVPASTLVPPASIVRPSRTPAQRRGVYGCIPQRGQLVVKLEQGDRDPGHLEARDVVADEAARGGDAVLLELLRQFRVDEVELDRRGAAEAVHEREDVRARSGL